MKVKSESEVAQSCPTLSNPMDCSPPGSSTHGIFQARVLQWGAIAFSVSLLKEMLLKTYVRNFCRSLAKLCPLCNLRDFSTPGFPVLHCLTEFAQLMSIESVMSSNHLILCHPLVFLPSIFPGIRVFGSELACCIRWAKYWNFCFSINPSNEYSGLISFRIDWFDLLAVQRTLRSLLQHHSLKASEK